MKQVYVLLSRTQTLPSRFVHKFTGGNFTHASLSLHPRTDSFFSYARRNRRNILIAGMISEDTQKNIFAEYPESPCVLLELTVDDGAYERIKSRVDLYRANFKKAKYNFVGALLMRMGIVWRRRYRLTCSQFVAISLLEGGVELPKDPYLMMPNDFMEIDGYRKIYDGSVKNCNFMQAACNT